MKRIFLLVTLFFTATQSRAEFNIGFHTNPTLTMASIGSSSAVDKYTKVKPVRLGYNVGANLNFRKDKIGIELGLNLVGKSMKEIHRVGSNFGYNTYYTLAVPTTAYEFPLLVGYLVYHNKNEDANYDLYIQAGAAYEIDNTGKGASTSTSNEGANNLLVIGGYKGPATQSVITPVVGVKINAVVRNLGLIDYGIYYHFPLQETGPYVSDATYKVGISTGTVTNTLYSRLSYIDIKLCYYFYSIGRDGKKIRYKGQ
jgi:hypothetical protein